MSLVRFVIFKYVLLNVCDGGLSESWFGLIMTTVTEVSTFWNVEKNRVSFISLQFHLLKPLVFGDLKISKPENRNKKNFIFHRFSLDMI